MNAGTIQELVEQQAPLYRLALGLTHDTGRAHDLVQDSLLKALLNRDKFRPDTDLGAWMRTILRHTFINQHRRMRLTRLLEGDMERHRTAALAATSRADDPLERMAASEVEASLARLRPTLAEPFRLFHEGFKYHEVAARMGLPIGTVKSRIHQARQTLSAYVGSTR